MLKEVDKVIWNKEINGRYDSIFNQVEYLETISKLHKTKLKFFVFNHKSEAIIGFATHIKRHKVIIPDHYSYSSFWIKESLGEFSRFDFIDLMLKELKTKFKIINFKLSPQFYDVRAFSLNGFSTKANYTYINKNDSVLLRNDLARKLKKTKSLNFKFVYDDYYEEILKQQTGDFNAFGYSQSQTRFYQKYFQSLIDKGFLKSFCIRLDEKLIASALILIDFKNSLAYNLLISSSKTNYHLESSTLLYIEIMQKIKELKIESFDFYGADMKGIAHFKSGFRGKLTTHYVLKYGFNEQLNERVSDLKLIIKKFLY